VLERIVKSQLSRRTFVHASISIDDGGIDHGDELKAAWSSRSVSFASPTAKTTHVIVAAKRAISFTYGTSSGSPYRHCFHTGRRTQYTWPMVGLIRVCCLHVATPKARRKADVHSLSKAAVEAVWCWCARLPVDSVVGSSDT
jgi:hypothetical protein